MPQFTKGSFYLKKATEQQTVVLITREELMTKYQKRNALPQAGSDLDLLIIRKR